MTEAETVVPSGESAVVFDADAEIVNRSITVRPLSVDEGLRRLRQRSELAKGHAAPSESAQDRHSREAREADVVEAARRSQAEIRRHVDSYLKEHFETIAADIATVVVNQVHDRILRGVAEMQETQAIAIDRLAADVRAQMRAFARGAWGSKPASPARRASKGARKRGKAKK